MNYTQLTEKKKVEIDILLKQGMSMRKVASALEITKNKKRVYNYFLLYKNKKKYKWNRNKVLFRRD